MSDVVIERDRLASVVTRDLYKERTMSPLTSLGTIAGGGAIEIVTPEPLAGSAGQALNTALLNIAAASSSLPTSGGNSTTVSSSSTLVVDLQQFLLAWSRRAGIIT